jgi:hypothetical protein
MRRGHRGHVEGFAAGGTAAVEVAAVVRGHAAGDRGGGGRGGRLDGGEVDRLRARLRGGGEGLIALECGVESGIDVDCGGPLFGVTCSARKRHGGKEKQASDRAFGHDPDLPFGADRYTGARPGSP